MTISLSRIKGLTLRHFYHFRHNFDRWTDAIYWPVMDLVLWGFATKYLAETNSDTAFYLYIMVTSLIFWQLVWRANYEISVNLLEEFWNRNLVNLFCTPLNIIEWILGVMLLGFLKNILTITVGVIAAFLLYQLHILETGLFLLPAFFVLNICGWFMGFLASSLIVYKGKKVQTVAWMSGYLFAPLSGVFYPVEVLPGWAQSISKFLPMTYVYKALRSDGVGGIGGINGVNTVEIVNQFGDRYYNLMIGLGLGVLYLVLSILIFIYAFKKTKIRGLVALEG